MLSFTRVLSADLRGGRRTHGGRMSKEENEPRDAAPVDTKTPNPPPTRAPERSQPASSGALARHRYLLGWLPERDAIDLLVHHNPGVSEEDARHAQATAKQAREAVTKRPAFVE